VRHPFGVNGLILISAIWIALGWLGLASVVVGASAGLLVWRRLHEESYYRLVVSRWRAYWVYRRCWQPAMHNCGLSTDGNGHEYLPRLRRVLASRCVDRVLVDLLSGQSPEDFEPHAGPHV
jgi:S-DNA-T family DNA segregation ATPase FtsK/SpoIIIE